MNTFIDWDDDDRLAPSAPTTMAGVTEIVVHEVRS